MKASLCPVCNGAGEAGDWMKGLPLTTKSKCWGCGGKGWVEVGEDIPLFIDPNKCPNCGGDRYSPGLAGCPSGSHYR